MYRMRYSIWPRDQCYVKGYGFLSFTQSMDKKLSKYGQRLLGSIKNSAMDTLKTALKRAVYANCLAWKIDEASIQPIRIPKEKNIL